MEEQACAPDESLRMSRPDRAGEGDETAPPNPVPSSVPTLAQRAYLPGVGGDSELE